MNELTGLVLSLFPGADLLGRAFEADGWCVVRGPELMWDQRIEDFRGVAGRFDGIIGGPPCVHYSDANRNRDPAAGDRLVIEFLRVVEECRPEWFVMENVRNVPDVIVSGWSVQRLDLNDVDFGGQQGRLRHVQFGSMRGDIIRPVRQRDRPGVKVRARGVVTTKPGRCDRPGRRAALQGFPGVRLRCLRRSYRDAAIGNGVPAGMGRALSAAVIRRSPPRDDDCGCGCGRVLASVNGRQKFATVACRKRAQMRREGRYRSVMRPLGNA